MNTINPYEASVVEEPWAVDEQAKRETWLEQSSGWLLFSFRGRIPRLAYWGGNLIVTVVYLIAIFAAFRFIKNVETLRMATTLIALPTFWVSLALQVKRWHDRDKSGFWFFIVFIPFIGPLWSLIELGFCRGTYGPNKYGNEM